MRLTLRTLLAYLDDTLEPAEAREIGLKVAENPAAQELIDRIKKVTRRRGLATPPSGSDGSASDPNRVAEYLSDALSSDQLAQMEQTCLDSDVHLAEVAACHQILTLVLSEQIRVPPTARQRMYQLVKGRESIPHRKPGATIPIGGVREDEKFAGPDDAEASLMLGLPAYSSETPGRRIGRVVAICGLIAILAFTIWMTIPKAERLKPGEPVAVATGPTPVKNDANGSKVIQKVEVPIVAPPVAPVDPGKTDPPMTPTTPSKDLVPTTPAPREDRIPIGKWDKSSAILVRKPQESAQWLRAMPDDPTIFSTERVIALPGYKATLQLEGPIAVDLWGNLPELFPALVLESSVTPSAPGEGFNADLTLHQGRVYISTKRPEGAKVRVRFLQEVWDLQLADGKTEVVFELIHRLTPGEFAERPLSSVGMAVREGQVTLKLPYRPDAKVGKGGEAYWDNKGGKTEIQPSPPAGERPATYWSKLVAPQDGPRAEATLSALSDFSLKLNDPQRVRATFDYALQLKEEQPTPAAVAAARVAVLAFAAIGDLPGLVDALADQLRYLLRRTAYEGLHSALSFDADASERFTKLLVDKQRMTEDDAKFALWLLRGFNAQERRDPASLDRLQTGLNSSSLAIRELAFQNLLAFLKPDERVPEVLLRFDAAAPPEVREPVAKIWKVKIESMKQELMKAPPSTTEPAPPPRPKK